MYFAWWALIIGALLITMTLAGSLLQRLPLSTGMLYLAAGAGLGPAGLGLLTPDPSRHASLLQHAAEVALLISLFAIGLKLGVPFADRRWRLPARLATVSMVVAVVLVAAIGHFALQLPPGLALLLGAILAPTDPVLASDVQVVDAMDRDRLRFSLSAEGGLNDGTAMPFVLLGLAWLDAPELGEWTWRWLVVDVAWALVAGLALGGACGAAIGRLVVYLRTRHQLSVGLDEFLGLGLIALAYGLALLCHANGFLAVLAAGVALQRVQQVDVAGVDERRIAARIAGTDDTREAVATDTEYAGAYMMREVQVFNDQLERIAELAVVLVVGAMLAYVEFEPRTFWLVLLLLFVVRPVSVWVGLLGETVSRDHRWLISWFGIRGIGSVYYLTYAMNHGLSAQVAQPLLHLTLTAVAVSIVLHGISVTPLMQWYVRRRGVGDQAR